MKKLTLALMAILAMALVIGFAGCANGSKDKEDSNSTPTTNASVVGTWKLTSGTCFDTMEIKNDGTGKFYLAGVTQDQFTYSVSGNTITINATDDENNHYTLSGTVTGSTIVLNFEGEQITYTKQ